MLLQLAVPLPVPTDPPPEEGVLGYLGLDACVRLPMRVDAARLAAEIHRLPQEVWSRAERGPVVFAAVESFFAVGYPRGSKSTAADDRPALAHLPYLREILHEILPSPMRALVARQSAQGLIPIHTDDRRYFRRTVRLSIQVEADGPQRLYCDGLWYDLGPGEVWALNNLVPHGVKNTSGRGRINVIADFLPSSELVELILNGDHGLGVRGEAARLELEAISRAQYRKYRWQSIFYGIVKRWRRRGER